MGEIAQAGGLIEKLGVIGALLIFGFILVKEVLRLRAENRKVYVEVDFYRSAYILWKSAGQAANLKVDESVLKRPEHLPVAAPP